MATLTMDQLGQIKRANDNNDVDTLRIIGQKPTMSAAESEIQRILETRAAQERAAQLERPTYGMWGLKEGENEQHIISSDPNRIAEINAHAEMKRTGLDRYYRPQSGAYFEAFNKIRDKYLQQELGKKAAVEAEGRAIVANRLGAFDKILQERAEAAKNSGLNALREAQAKEALAKAGNEERPKGQKVEKQHRDVFEDAMHQHFSQYLDIPTKNLNETMTALVDDGNYGKTTFQNTMIKGTNIPVSLLYNKGLSAYETAISQGFTTGDALNIASTAMQKYISDSKIKAPAAEGVGSSGVVRKYNSHEEVLSALKGVDAGTAVQILRANNMTVEDLRKIGQPKTNYPKTQEVAKKKRPHEMTPEELNKADVEYWDKWKTAAGRVSPIAPKSPSEQAAEFNKAVEYNRQLAEWANKRNLFGQR